MKYLIASMVMALTLGVFAEDHYMYFMVDAEKIDWEGGAPSDTIAYARVGVMNNTTGENAGYLNIYNQSGEASGVAVASIASARTGLFAGRLEDFGSAYSFYIELMSESKVLGRTTEVLSYADAMIYATTFGGTGPLPSSAFGQGGLTMTMAPIPEPNSAMLVLLGLAALGLKRKAHQNRA